MRATYIKIFKFSLFLSIGLAILWYLYSVQEAAYLIGCKEQGITDCSFATKMKQDFQSVKYFWVVLVVLAYLASNISRALLWNMLLNPLGKKMRFSTTFLAILIGYFANAVFPRAGEVVKCGVISKYEGVPVDKVFGTVITERIIDMITIIGILLLALFFQFDIISNQLLNTFPNLSNSLYISIVIILIIFLIIIFRKQIGGLNMLKKLKKVFTGFSEGLHTIFKLKRPLLFILYVLFTWLMYYLMVYFTFFAFEPTEHLSAVSGLVVFIFAAFGIGAPSPGGMGAYQFLVMTALASFYLIDKSDAFIFSNIAFIFPYMSNIVFGIISMMVLPFLKRHNNLTLKS